MGRARDRFEIRELTGYSAAARRGDTGGRPTTDVYVLDRLDCWKIVASYMPSHMPLAERRLSAQSMCDALNEWYRRWLHAGRWTPGEDAQAAKGTGS